MMIWIFLAAGIMAADLAVKRYIDSHKKEREEEKLAGGRIIVTRFHNEGAILGLMKTHRSVLLGVSAGLMGLLTCMFAVAVREDRSPLMKGALSLMLGGAASNVWDRIFRHRVTDYFRINMGPKRLRKMIFNLGDMALFAGVLLWLIDEIANEK